jgi:hypothetical protein
LVAFAGIEDRQQSACAVAAANVCVQLALYHTWEDLRCAEMGCVVGCPQAYSCTKMRRSRAIRRLLRTMHGALIGHMGCLVQVSYSGVLFRTKCDPHPVLKYSHNAQSGGLTPQRRQLFDPRSPKRKWEVNTCKSRKALHP